MALRWPFWLQIILVAALVGSLWALLGATDVDGKQTERGDEYFLRGQPDLAERSYRQALADTPTNDAAQIGLARALIAQDQLAEAETLLSAAQPSEREGLLPLAWGWYWYAQDDYPAAIAAFQDAVALIDADWQGYEFYQIADAYAGLGWALYSQAESCEPVGDLFARAYDLDTTSDWVIFGQDLCN